MKKSHMVGQDVFLGTLSFVSHNVSTLLKGAPHSRVCMFLDFLSDTKVTKVHGEPPAKQSVAQLRIT